MLVCLNPHDRRKTSTHTHDVTGEVAGNQTTLQLHTHTHTPAVEQGKELPSVVQVVARHPAEAEGVEVAEGDRWEHDQRSSHLIKLGDVGVLEVKLDSVHAHHHQHTHRGHEEQNPQAALDTHPLISEHVRDAVQRGPGGENFNGSRPLVVNVVRVRFEIHYVPGYEFRGMDE